ncbi:substrate-binding domain-containing protein, partial [Roseateles sp.]|uniref:substrate-binding domain-containing protein n=1 Tax=Roseateles sp. TaxID=1971397 RepID=UPI003919F8B1
SSGVPCVHVMETSPQEGVYSVGFSQSDAGAAMTQSMMDRGYQRIAFAAAQLDPRTLQRAQGYRQAMKAAGRLDPKLEWLSPERSSLALGGELFERIHREDPKVDAIFFNNDDLAQGALLAALRLGIKIPERLAVAGFNDLTGSDQMLPPLSTVRTPRSEIGREAAAMLLKLMRGESLAEPHRDLGFEVLMRGSC